MGGRTSLVATNHLGDFTRACRGPTSALRAVVKTGPTSARSLRIGVAGCGYWGSKHVRVLQSLGGVAETVVIDPRRDRTSELVAVFPRVRACASLAEAMDGIDALIVATPPDTHADIAMRALLNGKHVLVEKPFTTTVSDAERLVQRADESRLTLMVGHTFQYNSAVRWLREFVQSGGPGRVLYVDAARLNLGTYQRTCNVLWDLAPHDIAIINYLLDSTPRSVQAWAAQMMPDGPGHEDVAYLLLDYADIGVKAEIHVSWLDPKKVRRLTVVGDQKMVVYNDLADDERIRIFDKGVELNGHSERYEQPMSYRHGSIVAPFIPFKEPLSMMDRHFLQCIADRVTPETDGRNGLAVVRVLAALQRSIAYQQPIPVDGEMVHQDAKAGGAR